MRREGDPNPINLLDILKSQVRLKDTKTIEKDSNGIKGIRRRSNVGGILSGTPRNRDGGHTWM